MSIDNCQDKKCIGQSVCQQTCNSDCFFGNLIWLSTKEAAAYLRLSVGALKNKIYRGEIFPRKFGRLNRFNRKELDRLLGIPNERSI